MTARSGQPVKLDCTFEVSGSPANATTISLTVTYGSSAFQGQAVYGPVTFSGATSPAAGQVWTAGTGLYSAVWPIPAGTPAGAYVANWNLTDSSGNSYSEPENFYVTGPVAVPVPAGDTGYWTGALLHHDASLDIEFGTVDSSGIAWLWQRIAGWDGPPVQGGGVIPRAGDHGGWASPQYYAPRTLTLTVSASAPTQALRDTARAVLQRAVPVDGLAVLRYDEPVPKIAYVRRSGALTEAYPTLTDVTFTIGLVAPDMRKYSVQQGSAVITPMPAGGGGLMTVPFRVPFSLTAAPPPGAAAVVNNGTFGCPPVAVLRGPVQGPALTNLTTGDTVSWPSLTLGANDVLAVDFLNREAFVNPAVISTVPGTPSSTGTYWPADIGSSWWTVEPGANAVQVGGITGAGCTASVYYSDTWI